MSPAQLDTCVTCHMMVCWPRTVQGLSSHTPRKHPSLDGKDRISDTQWRQPPTPLSNARRRTTPSHQHMQISPGQELHQCALCPLLCCHQPDASAKHIAAAACATATTTAPHNWLTKPHDPAGAHRHTQLLPVLQPPHSWAPCGQSPHLATGYIPRPDSCAPASLGCCCLLLSGTWRSACLGLPARVWAQRPSWRVLLCSP